MKSVPSSGCYKSGDGNDGGMAVIWSLEPSGVRGMLLLLLTKLEALALHSGTFCRYRNPSLATDAAAIP